MQHAFQTERRLCWRWSTKTRHSRRSANNPTDNHIPILGIIRDEFHPGRGFLVFRELRPFLYSTTADSRRLTTMIRSRISLRRPMNIWHLWVSQKHGSLLLLILLMKCQLCGVSRAQSVSFMQSVRFCWQGSSVHQHKEKIDVRWYASDLPLQYPSFRSV